MRESETIGIELSIETFMKSIGKRLKCSAFGIEGEISSEVELKANRLLLFGSGNLIAYWYKDALVQFTTGNTVIATFQGSLSSGISLPWDTLREAALQATRVCIKSKHDNPKHP